MVQAPTLEFTFVVSTHTNKLWPKVQILPETCDLYIKKGCPTFRAPSSLL